MCISWTVGLHGVLAHCVTLTSYSQNGLGAVFLKEGVVSALLLLAASSANAQSDLQMSEDLRMTISVALSKLHESLGRDKEMKDLLKEKCTTFVHSHISKDSSQSKVEGLTALATLLQGALEVGNQVFGEETVLAEMVKMAELDDVNCQAIAAEALALAASDKERCHGIMKEGLPVLKALYSSRDDGVRVRALVGLCKLGSVGGSNVNARTFTEGSTVKLEKACRKFLVQSKKGDSLKKWATEGLAFLSLDADVKEALIGDEEALKSLFQIPQTQDQSLLYGIATIFVNLTNSYDKRERNKELEELGKFAGENMPKDHDFDGEEYQKKRVSSLLRLGVVSALVSLSAVSSMAVHEQVSRVLLALTENPAHRGAVIQQGGAKSLVPLATNNTDKGKLIAAQALAKIGITNDPRLAFPGQRSLEVVRPLVGLLKSEHSLQQFEGLMALTNLAGMSDDIRRRIFKEGGFHYIESLMFEDHEMLRRAATEVMCNLVLLKEVHECYYSDEVERVKLLTLFSGEEDESLAKAASGALAQLTRDPKICTKVMAVKAAKEILKELLVKENVELQHRGIFILANLIDASKEIAEELVGEDFLEIVMALAQSDGVSDNVKEAALSALQKAQEYELIKPNPELKK